MRDRVLPASPNWYCSRCSDTNGRGTLGFGARNTIYLIDVASPSCRVVGELVGHRERVSGFSFSQHAGQSQLCVSCSDDGTIKFWDADDKVLLKEHSPHQNTMTAVQWSPVDKNLVVSGDEKGIVVCHWYHTGDTLSFFPEPRTIFCLSCSPHAWNLVAVGYKDGMIVLMDISKKGEVLHRLRGHDDEIHALSWSPSANEESLYVARPDDVTATNGELHGEEKREETGGFLASGSKDQTIRIWSTARGKGVMTLKLPFLKRRGSVDPTVKERLWLSVHWPKGRPTQLLSSCFSGELVLWDLTKTGKQKWTLLGSSSEGQNHTRIVFNMSSVCLQDGRELLFSTSMDREVKCWDLSSLDCLWTLPTLGGFVYALTFSPVATGCLALGTGDNMIRVWSTMSLQNVYETRTFWQGIKSKVTALAWHPKKEGSLAFGTDDGKVGIYDAFANKSPHVSSSYHRKTVYSLAWGPPVPPMSFGGSDRPSHTLYSCAGEGNILQHDPWNLSGDASEVDKLIKDTNGIKHKLSAHTDISWKPDNRVVAIGNEDGSIDVYEAPSLKQLCSIQQHHKIINCLRWHGDHGPQPQHHFLLASGSTNAVIYVHDLRSVIEKPPASAVVITEPYRSLSGHTAKVTGLAWSPHHEARLVTVCYDGTAQVWDVQQETGVCNYRDHRGRLLCVDWSPVDPDVVWTGADDFTVQEWRVSQQEFTAPPKGKKIVDLRDKQKPKSKAKKKKSGASGPGGGGSVPSPGPSVNGDSTGKGGRGAESSLPARQEPSDEDDEEEKRSSLPLPVSLPASADAARKSSTTSKTKERPDVVTSLKKRRLRSMLPLSTSMDHRPRDLQLQDCLTLAALSHTHTPSGGCVPGQGEYIHLGLFTDRQALYRMLQEEEEGHAEAAHYDSIPYLRLWSGDLQGALQLATERGELSDHLLSLAPMAGYQVWSRTVEAYVKQLCLQEQHLKAASHLLSINRVYPAIDLLQCNKLYREAIALAKARLQPDDPVLKELFLSWAAILEKDGHLSSAAKCYLAAGAGFDAAKVLSRKSDALSLETAAGVARLSGEAGLAASLCLRLAKDLAADDDWLAAQRALNTQDALLVHRLYFSVTELLTLTLSDCRVLPWSCTSAHPWSQSCEPPGAARGLRHRIMEVWAKEFSVSEELTDKETLRRLLQELKAVENPQPSPNLPLKQVVWCVSLCVSQAVVSLLLCDCVEEVTSLWQAVSGTGEHFCLCSALCALLFPDGAASLRCFPEDQEEAGAASVSLQALICYHRLYETWWKAVGTHRNQPSADSAYGNNQASTHSNSTSNQPSADSAYGNNQASTHSNSTSHQPLADSASANNQASTHSNSTSHQPLADSASANNQASTHSNSTSHQPLADSASANNQASTHSNSTSHQPLADSASANNQASTHSNSTSHQPSADSASANNQALTDSNSTSHQPLAYSTSANNQASTDSNSTSHQPLAYSTSANNQASTDSNSTSHQPLADSTSANNQALTDSNSTSHQPLADSASANNQASTCENGINQSEVSTPNVDRSERVSPDAPLSESDVCVSAKNAEGRDWMEACPVLLSESHAAYQATQRAVTDIQDRLSVMVARHSAAPLGTQPPPAIVDVSSTEPPSDGTRIPTDQESLLSLSSKMTEYKRELEQLPSTVKTFPRPDVMECCLVLLHLSGGTSMVPPALQEKAKELLGRYATTPSLHTASHRFLT